MAVKARVMRYQDEFVDEQVTPNVIHQTAVYLVYDSVVGRGTSGSAPLELPLDASDADQALRVKTAVRNHIRDVITFDLVPAIADIKIPAQV